MDSKPCLYLLEGHMSLLETFSSFVVFPIPKFIPIKKTLKICSIISVFLYQITINYISPGLLWITAQLLRFPTDRIAADGNSFLFIQDSETPISKFLDKFDILWHITINNYTSHICITSFPNHSNLWILFPDCFSWNKSRPFFTSYRILQRRPDSSSG